MPIAIPSLSINFDPSSLATLEGEVTAVEEAFIKLLLIALKEKNKDLCKTAAKFVQPDMISDSRMREIYENILKDPDIDSVVVRLNGSKNVFANLLQKAFSEKIIIDKNIFFSIVEQLREIYAKKQAVKKLQFLDKCCSLDRIFMAIDSLKEDISGTCFIEESIHPFFIGALEPEDLEKDIKWLIPNILFPQSINVFFGPPSHGKSLLAFGVGVELIRRNIIDHLCYLDGDNPLVILQHRGISKILKEFNRDKKRIIYHNISSAETMQRYLENLVNFPGNNLIIIDSLKDLAGNLNLNDQRDSTYLQSLIQKVRNGSRAVNTNTIIVLHHENKAKEAKGNGIFLDGADCAYQFQMLFKKQDYVQIKLINKKSRLPVESAVILKIYTGGKYFVSKILNDYSSFHTSIKQGDKNDVLSIQTYLQNKYKMGVKKISLKEISEKLGISEKKLKYYGQNYNDLWSFDNNHFALLNKNSDVELDLWTNNEFSLDPLKNKIFY